MARGRWLTPETAGDVTISRCLSIPEHLQPAVNWALEQLLFVSNWEQEGALTPQECVDALAVAIDAYYVSEDCMAGNLPTEIFVFWIEARVVAGNALAANLSTTQWYLTAWHQNAPALNDIVDFSVVLDDGDYDLTIVGQKRTNGAILHVFIDGVEDANTIDLYASSNSQNNEMTISVNVPTGGKHVIQFRASSKNASSSGYDAQVVFFTMKRTGP
jgi:hypothetical protein